MNHGATGPSRCSDGFTVIELITVIVILAILGAVALPKFVDLQSNARRARAQATSAAVASGATLIHARWLASGSPASVTINGVAIPVNSSGWPSSQYWHIRVWGPDLTPYGNFFHPDAGLVEYLETGRLCGFLYSENNGSVTTLLSGC